MLFGGSLELELEPILTLTGSEVGCAFWVEVGVAICRLGLDGLDGVGSAEGVVVVGEEDLDVNKWLVVEVLIS